MITCIMITITFFFLLATLGDYDRVQMRYGKPIYRKTNNPTYFLAHWGSLWRVVIRASFTVQPRIQVSSGQQCPYNQPAGSWQVFSGSAWSVDSALSVICIQA